MRVSFLPERQAPGILRFLPRAVALTLVAVGYSYAAASAQLSVGFTPDSAIVRPGIPDHIYVTVTNSGDSTINSIQTSWLPSDSVRVQVDPEWSWPSQLRATEAVSFFITVEGRSRPMQDRALLRLSYRVGSGRAGSTVASFEVRPRPTLAAADLVGVTVLSSIADLTDRAQATVVLRLENKQDHPVAVDMVAGAGPDFVAIAPHDSGSTTIPPKGTILRQVQVATDTWVRPGGHTLTFEVPIRWTGPDGGGEATLVASSDVGFSVLGESGILQVLSVPSFLLLPGFLLVVAFGMVTSPLADIPNLADKPNRPQFWVVSIGLSLVSVFVFESTISRSVLTGYGLRDIAQVWLICGLAGAVSGGFVSLIVRITAAVAKQRKTEAEQAADRVSEQRTPTTSDAPETLLGRVAHLDVATIQLPEVTISAGDAEHRGYLLTESGLDGQAWSVPKLVYEWLPGGEPADRRGLETVLSNGDLKPVAETLLRLVAAQKLRLFWTPPGATPSPLPEGFTRSTPRVFIEEA